jgi:hypothetical protein
MLGALLFGGGTGTAHAYTDNEMHYLAQLNELQVPGSDQTRLKLGNEVCVALRAGDRPRADISVLQQRTELSLYAATNVVMEATAWPCPDPEREVRPRLLDRKPASARRMVPRHVRTRPMTTTTLTKGLKGALPFTCAV